MPFEQIERNLFLSADQTFIFPSLFQDFPISYLFVHFLFMPVQLAFKLESSITFLTNYLFGLRIMRAPQNLIFYKICQLRLSSGLHCESLKELQLADLPLFFQLLSFKIQVLELLTNCSVHKIPHAWNDIALSLICLTQRGQLELLLFDYMIELLLIPLDYSKPLFNQPLLCGELWLLDTF